MIHSPAWISFLKENEEVNLQRLIFKKSPFPNISMPWVVEQLKGRKIAQKKWPEWYQCMQVLYPPSINLQQASSEITAKFKARLIGPKKRVLDVTGGFGADTFFLAKTCDSITYLERNPELFELVQHNFEALKASNIHCFPTDLHDFLLRNETFDAIFLDPDRRPAGDGKRKFLLQDLSPNLLEILPALFKHTPEVWVKLSPLLDIHAIFEHLPALQQLFLLAHKNEMKEIVIQLKKEKIKHPLVQAIHLESKHKDLVFPLNEKTPEIAYAPPNKYIYLPNAAIMKSGKMDALALNYTIKKLHPNTHLYTAEECFMSFPGRIFSVNKVDKKQIRGQCFQVIHRNFPQNLEEIKKKYKLKVGGEQYLIFCASIEGKEILIGHLVKS